MSSEDAENDHDYAASRQRNLAYNNSDDDFETPVTSSTRRGISIRIRNYRAAQQNNHLGLSSGFWSIVPAVSEFSERNNGSISDQEDNDDAETATDSTSQASINTITTIDSVTSSDVDQMSQGSVENIYQGTYAISENSSTTTSSSEETNSSTIAAIHQEPVPQDETPAVSDVVAAISEPQHNNNNETVVNLSSPSQPKKRKRLSLEANQNNNTPKVKPKNSDDIDDEDDGLTCPICLDNWEMSGEHRLASLKCGHLFGDSCIRRWLRESSRQSGQKVCPQCKTKAQPKEIRYLYAKRLRAIDRSEEHIMREQLNGERSRSKNIELELATLKMSYAQVTQKLKLLEADNDSLNTLLRTGGSYLPCPTALNRPPSVMYKLFLDRNIEISREPGSRVMTYSEQHASLLVSQKSSQGLFPGYGLRFVDTTSFKPTNFLYTSIKLLRDISLSVDQQFLAAASMEPKVKLFDLRTLQVTATFKPAEKPLWSCAIGRQETEHYLYLGSQQGSTYVYDIRFPETIVDEHQTEGDMSPVIQVASIPACALFPCGGFLVCKLTSLWFYEHSGGITNATRFRIEGRFISMHFDAVQQNLLVQTRSCIRFPRARYILGKLNKINDIPLFEIKVTFFASTNSPVMARCSQIAVESNTLVAAYIQDSKLLSLYDANRVQLVQSLPAQEVVYDTCPIYTKEFTYLAALTETKCRLYKLNTT